MSGPKVTTKPCGKDQKEDPDRPGVCIDIVPVFSRTSTVFQGPDCWPTKLTVPTNRLGPFVQRAMMSTARKEFEGLSVKELRKKLRDLTGRRARMKKTMGAAKKARAK